MPMIPSIRQALAVFVAVFSCVALVVSPIGLLKKRRVNFSVVMFHGQSLANLIAPYFVRVVLSQSERVSSTQRGFLFIQRCSAPFG